MKKNSNLMVLNNLGELYISKNHPYLRPFLCKGEFLKAKVMVAGINPATPIGTQDISLTNYIDLISEYDEFMTYYKSKRISEGKREVSRTRQGISSFVEWINSNLGVGVIESDICTYPAKSLQELKRIDKKYQQLGIHMFWNVLQFSNVDTLIVYGIWAFRAFLELLRNMNYELYLMDNCNVSLGEIECIDIRLLEEISPVGFIYLEGRKIKVYSCRHLMYYGSVGASYEKMKRKLYDSYCYANKDNGT